MTGELETMPDAVFTRPNPRQRNPSGRRREAEHAGFMALPMVVVGHNRSLINIRHYRKPPFITGTEEKAGYQ
ncbi:hypothetical protein sS8_0246 [Methylocaldum marinum]|uniref:Uncharacterized protein n=1 Tax=Methylocaldum marinum TaxID=1432792 RepID=A0A286P3J2_9GAMM|nr:hypothetical protein sS8_0246 [Methylocaldum marinum]